MNSACGCHLKYSSLNISVKLILSCVIFQSLDCSKTHIFFSFQCRSISGQEISLLVLSRKYIAIALVDQYILRLSFLLTSNTFRDFFFFTLGVCLFVYLCLIGHCAAFHLELPCILFFIVCRDATLQISDFYQFCVLLNFCVPSLQPILATGCLYLSHLR